MPDSRRIGSPVDPDATHVPHRHLLVGRSHPNCGRQRVRETDEPGVFIVVRGPGLTGGFVAVEARCGSGATGYDPTHRSRHGPGDLNVNEALRRRLGHKQRFAVTIFDVGYEVRRSLQSFRCEGGVGAGHIERMHFLDAQRHGGNEVDVGGDAHALGYAGDLVVAHDVRESSERAVARRDQLIRDRGDLAASGFGVGRLEGIRCSPGVRNLTGLEPTDRRPRRDAGFERRRVDERLP